MVFLTLQSLNVHTEFMRERDVQRARAVQVGQLMRSYRESFLPGRRKAGVDSGGSAGTDGVGGQ